MVEIRDTFAIAEENFSANGFMSGCLSLTYAAPAFIKKWK